MNTFSVNRGWLFAASLCMVLQVSDVLGQIASMTNPKCVFKVYNKEAESSVSGAGWQLVAISEFSVGTITDQFIAQYNAEGGLTAVSSWTASNCIVCYPGTTYSVIFSPQFSDNACLTSIGNDEEWTINTGTYYKFTTWGSGTDIDTLSPSGSFGSFTATGPCASDGLNPAIYANCIEETQAPTQGPTPQPTPLPTVNPTATTNNPTASTSDPTNNPSPSPTPAPTDQPTDGPTNDPTDGPTSAPTPHFDEDGSVPVNTNNSNDWLAIFPGRISLYAAIIAFFLCLTLLMICAAKKFLFSESASASASTSGSASDVDLGRSQSGQLPNVTMGSMSSTVQFSSTGEFMPDDCGVVHIQMQPRPDKNGDHVFGAGGPALAIGGVASAGPGFEPGGYGDVNYT